MTTREVMMGAAGAAGIQFVGRIGNFATNTSPGATLSLTSLVGGISSSAASGDFVIVAYVLSDQSVLTPTITTSGYTTISSFSVSDIYDTNLRVSYKRLSTPADTSVAVGATGNSGTAGIAMAFVFRGVSPTTPFDVSTTTASILNTAVPTPPAITPITTGALIVAIGAGASGENSNSYTSSDLSSFYSITRAPGYFGYMGIGLKAWTSGTFTPARFNLSGSDNSFNSSAGVTIALRPA